MEYHDQRPLRNVGDVADMAAERYGDKMAFEYRGDEMTYAELADRSDALAGALQGEGVAAGDRVAILIENSLRYPEAFFGVIKAGAVPLPLNHRMDVDTLRYVVGDGDAEILIAGDAFESTAADLLDGTGLRAAYAPEPSGDAVGDVDAFIEGGGAPGPTDRGWEDVAIQPYTSGTTGDPKGVLLTHENVLTTLRSYGQLGGGDPETDSTLVVLPLFHLFGLVVVLLNSTYNGIPVVMRTLPVPTELLSAITEHEITSFAAVPAIYNEMLNAYEADPESYDLSSIERIGSAAAPLSDEVRRRVEDAFGVPLMEGWGMTETTAAGAAADPRGSTKGAGCVGWPMPDFEIRLVDPETRTVRIDEDALDPLRPRHEGEDPLAGLDEEELTGEIAIRGPQVFQGYHGLPETNDAVFDDEGWFYTEDIARVDEEGELWMVDRADDMMIVGGENVYPAEVEDVLYDHPDIDEAAVVGAPHEIKGEAPVAFVTPQPGVDAEQLEEHEIRRFALDRVASYAHPRRVFVVSELPRSGTRKVQRYKLEVEAEERVGELEPSDEL
jgi:long-chain acyl-CoA synthetase